MKNKMEFINLLQKTNAHNVQQFPSKYLMIDHCEFIWKNNSNLNLNFEEKKNNNNNEIKEKYLAPKQLLSV